jgi:hypothetical protein
MIIVASRLRAGVRVGESAGQRRPLPRPASWSIGKLGVLDVAAALGLSAVEMAVGVGALHHTGPPISLAAAVGTLFMVCPVAWRRPWPLGATAVIAVATAANVIIFGTMVRCGVALPAAFLVAFAVGARCERGKAAAGLVLCAIGVVIEGGFDPRIGWPGLTTVLPVLVAFFAAGTLVRARSRTAAELRRQSAELRRQRERTARLAVAADREQLTADLEQTLHAQLSDIATAAATGLDRLPADEDAARQVMASIERDGRSALGQMRELVGSLAAPGESALKNPQPTLAALPALLATATTAATRLTIEGSQAVLPSGLDLADCRIVEHLLATVEDSPEAAVDVRLVFTAQTLELHVSGPRSSGTEFRAALAAAAERARLHGGSVRHRLDGRSCLATARLPLISGHA